MTSLLIGGISGGLGKFIVAPADRIKTIYQSSSATEVSIADITTKSKAIYRSEGVLGFWRGTTMSMYRLMPYDGIKFATYGYIHPYIGSNFVAGAIAGVCGEVITYPFETLRTLISYRIGHQTTYPQIIREVGMQRLYHGITPAIYSTIFYNGISFGIYNSDALESKVLKGTLGGFFGTTFCYPFETIKRRRQVGLTDTTMISVIQKEGIAGLYRGVTINWIKCPIVITVSFMSNEYLNSLLQ